METNNISDDSLRDYMDRWDKACKNNVIPPTSKKLEKPVSMYDDDSPQSLYWNQLYSEMTNRGTDDEWRPNPVTAYSLGKDQDHPKPQWVDNNIISELDEMKRKLYDLECKFLGKEQVNGDKAIEDPVEQASGVPFSKEIESLKKKLDDLSSKMSNGSVKLKTDRSPEDPDSL